MTAQEIFDELTLKVRVMNELKQEYEQKYRNLGPDDSDYGNDLGFIIWELDGKISSMDSARASMIEKGLVQFSGFGVKY